MTRAVLDSSAIIALLTGGRGAGRVAEVVADAATSVFNQAEVVGHFIHLGAPIEEVRLMLGALPYAIVPADEELAWDAGALRAATRADDLSIGGRFCIALAKRLGVPAYTADRAWRDIAAAAGTKIVVIG